MARIARTGSGFIEQFTLGTPFRSFDTYIMPKYESMCQLAAQAILAALNRLNLDKEGPRLRVVLSAGRTPVRIYEILAVDYASRFDWSRIELYQMDEYVDCDGEDPDFCRYLLERIVRPLGLESIHLLDRTFIGAGLDGWQAAIQAHERRLENAGGIDLVVHGVGINGHIGFNEPGSSPQSAGRVIELSDSTRTSMLAQSAPFRGVTLGLRVLISAKEAILVASGAHKAEAIAKTLNGPISDECPASWLRNSRKTTVILDAAAAAQEELALAMNNPPMSLSFSYRV